MERDAEHLKLLSMFYYIRGGISAFFSCFFLFYVLVGIILSALPPSARGNGPPAVVGFILMCVGSFIVLVGWTWSALVIFAGRCLAQRRHRVYCMVIAGISCLFVPYGTILGVFTFIVLQRPTVQQLFDQPLPAN
jgi:hypothetical protein